MLRPGHCVACPAAIMAKRRSMHCEHFPQCGLRIVMSCTRVQLRVSRINSLNPLAAMRSTISAFVSHMNGLMTSNCFFTSSENIARKPAMACG